MDFLGIGTLVTASMSALAAYGSWRAASRSAVVAQERYRLELRPVFDSRIIMTDGDNAVMHITLKGPVSLRTPGTIWLRIEDMPSELRDKMLTVHALGITSGQRGIPTQIWSPWEFAGGRRFISSDGVSFNQAIGAWYIRFALCKPLKFYPMLKTVREGASSTKSNRKLIAMQCHAWVFRVEVFVGQRYRRLRRVNLDETKTVRLRHTGPPTGVDTTEWANIYPPETCRLLARCKFGRWTWRVDLQPQVSKQP